MHLILNYTVLIILLYQCITIYGIEHEQFKDDFSYDEPKPDHNGNCVILFPMENNHNMPIPYQRNASGPAVINPGRTGYLFIAHDDVFQFSCAGSAFAAPPACAGLTEVTLKCLKGSTVSLKHKTFDFGDFRCETMPKAQMTMARTDCNGIANGVFNVGFDTLAPLYVYRVCFDARIRRTLYSWTYVDAPVWHSVQVSKTLPHYAKTGHFKDINMVSVYNLKAQNESKSLEGEAMAFNKILIMHADHKLVPGHLLTKNQFPYTFQQLATYFYENTAPQWLVFKKGIWIEVEKMILHSLNKASGKHLIVAGTIDLNQMEVPPETDGHKPFVLQWPDGIPVPESFWRLVYDVRNKTGVVFIGQNRPFVRGNTSKHFCEKMPCPGKFGKKIASMDMVFCCSKESFEKFYGPIDHIVYEEF